MKFARIVYGAGSSYAIVEDDFLRPIRGTPFDADPPTSRGDLIPVEEAEFLPPTEATKVIAVGRNYAAHAAEMGLELGDVPSIFMKPPNAMVGHGGVVVLPPTSVSTHVTHEAELAIVIGRPARNIPRSEALEYILGYSCADDVTARDLQRSDPQITRSKGFDTFCPIGPVIATDVDVRTGLVIECRVNGELRQQGSTEDLIFDVPTLVEHLSSWTTLLPGDIVLTGSPAGTAPLEPGDVVTITIDGVGTLSHGVAAA